MIPRITRGSSAAAALAYDFGPGRREEHVDARTVAGTVPGDWRAQAALIDQTVAAKPRVEKGIWRTSLRAAPQDRVLTDAEWGQIADRYVAEMGVSAHPWTATRHGDDHIHLTVSRVSWTGTVVPLHRDFPKAQAACRAIEAEHHLIDASQRFDKTRPQVVHGEREYAARRGLVPEREQLRALVGAVTSAAAGEVAQRVAAERAHVTSAVAQGRAPGQGQSPAGAAADLRGAFEARLEAAGVVYRANVASTGKVSGYSYGLAGHTDATGEQVFFKGSQLGKDHSWAATTRALEAGVARGVAQHLTRTQQVDRYVGQQSGERADHRTGRDAVAGRAAQDQPAQAPATRAASIDVQLERVREARRQRAAASAERSAEHGIEQGAGQFPELSSGLSDAQAFQQALQRFREQFGHSARQQSGGQPNGEPGREPVQPAAPRQASPDQRPDRRPDQQGDRPDKEQNARRAGELVSGPQRERLRVEHEAVQARTAELQRAARAAESSYDQAKQALTTAQHDLRAALDDRSVASGWVAQARGEVTRAAGDLEALRVQVTGRSWLGRARQQLAEDWGSVTGGRAGAPRGQVQAQVAAAQDRLVVAERYLGGRQRVLESVETRVSAARERVAQAESAVPATRLVADRAQVAYSQAVMRPTEYEQLTYREYLAANPEVARRRQEALDPTNAVNRARRRDRSPGPGRDPDRGRGFGR